MKKMEMMKFVDFIDDNKRAIKEVKATSYKVTSYTDHEGYSHSTYEVSASITTVGGYWDGQATILADSRYLQDEESEKSTPIEVFNEFMRDLLEA